ncbi:Clan SB, family S8, subtilisin-like serine peptidase [Tritrichomonas foetus]|uniref:Clan SB, family S8, subtilisin-like serine peptidase n=1 Tax=Tritrichomonas foetus TaxID=1144522 RepID=A0A1J4KEP8_9EUKA|nr:Clan SB, family S8, subtilisin-like serine peptidase [Tritrichomonas foetus]|eukprot:OHT09675.1 Clan SB, family S8, subtilisin-like serine peptidase [Tritrichomonas foetus]
MVNPGLKNYIDFSPYQTTTATHTSLLSFSSGWFLIRLLSSIANLTSFGNQINIHFSPDSMVANGWFKMYLNEIQYEYLHSSKMFELYSIEMKQKITAKSKKNGLYYVCASPDWEPPSGAKILSKISPTLFTVKNLAITKQLKNDPRILSISQVPKKVVKNRYSVGFLQTGDQKSVYSDEMYQPLKKLHKIGLDGTGQIINIVDTGVDMLNAMFYDANHSIDTITGKTNLNHRKVMRIENYADNKDYYNGHGTHVAGIAAGSAFCTQEKCGISQYNGVASGAKIYFSDVGYASISGDLSEEFDLAEQAKLLEKYDSWISSNSWSYDFPSSTDTYKYNKIAYEHPDILYLFAAGNDYSYFSINSPSEAKNIIAVGATNGPSSNIIELSKSKVIIKFENGQNNQKVNNKKNQKDDQINNQESLVFEGSDISNDKVFNNGVDTVIKYVYHLPVIPFINSSVNYTDSIVLFTSKSSCSDYYSVSTSAQAGIIASNNGLRCNSYPIPLVNVNPNLYETLFNLSKTNNASIFPYDGDNEILPKVAELSSKGPARTSLSKPDFAVPGKNIISAKSLGGSSSLPVSTAYKDSLTSNSGTSMATPAASGLAAIVRQFFIDGWYPSLSKSNNKIKPSSYLIKAMLINGANTDDKTPGPNFEVGFGIPCLEKVFGMKENTGLRIVDRETIESASHKVYSIYSDGSNLSDLIVTMVYLDPPLDPDNRAHLFADLDLVIKSPTGQYFIGNNVTEADSDAFSNSERIIIPKEEVVQGKYEIHIISSEYPLDEKVQYALVVNGPFDQNVNDEKNPLFLVSEKSNQCISDCSEHGTCHSGRCQCNDGFTGLTCNTKVFDLHENESNIDVYSHKKIKYFKISPTKKEIESNTQMTDVQFTIEKDRIDSYIYFCISTTKVGQIANSDWTYYLLTKSNTFSTPLPDDGSNTAYIALYASYNQPVTIEIKNISFTNKTIIYPTPTPNQGDSTNNDKMNRTLLYIVVPITVICLVVISVMAIFCIYRHKKSPIVDTVEKIDPTVIIDDSEIVL